MRSFHPAALIHGAALVLAIALGVAAATRSAGPTDRIVEGYLLRGVQHSCFALHSEEGTDPEVVALGPREILGHLVANRYLAGNMFSDWPSLPEGEAPFYVASSLLDQDFDPQRIVMFSNPATFRGRGGNVAYANGHILWLGRAEFLALTGPLMETAVPAPTGAELRAMATDPSVVVP